MIIWLILTFIFLTLISLNENSSLTIQNILSLFFSGTNIILFYVAGKYAFPNRKLHMNLIDQRYRKHYLYGLISGILMILTYFILGFVFQSYHFSGFGSIKLYELALYFIAFIFQGFAEEILVRGIFQEVLSKKSIWLSLLLPSLIFSLLHLLNDNFNFYAMINTFLIGLIFALMTQISGSLWMAAGAHTMWNFLLGPFFGQVLSGIPMPDVFFNLIPNKNTPLLTGGEYGPEASIMTLIILSVICLYLIYHYRKNEIRLYQ